MTTPDSTPASADSVMAKAMMLVGALDDSCEEATSLPFLEAVTALRAEAERLAAQAAPLAQQAREYPPLPKLPTMTVLSELQSGTQEMVRLDVAHEAMRAYVDADRAARVSPAEKTARMLTGDEKDEVLALYCRDSNDQDIQELSINKFCEVNDICLIPESGKLGEGA